MVGLRFLYFGEYIDDPHSWRQCDTAHYIYDFYENGIDLFHPSVCWMGEHGTTILEFPLPEAFIAVLYKVFGPDILWARLVFFLIFLVGVRYLYLIAKLISSQDFARMSILIYLAMPLGFYYSRAIHVDFTAIMFAHGMLYYFLIGFKRQRWQSILTGSLMASLAFMVKAPYVFYLAFPLLLWVNKHGTWKFLLRQTPVLAMPLLVFYLWQSHVHTVNESAPDWFFIPQYHKFIDMWGWYFGAWEMRKLPELWLSIHGHIEFEILLEIAWWPAVIGLLLRPLSFTGNFIRFWFLGTCLYVLIFFNLNFIHNYYQLPMMAPLALALAFVFESISKWTLPAVKIGNWVFLPAFLLFCFQGYQVIKKNDLGPAEQYYFQKYFTVSEVPVEAGKVVRANTEKGASIIYSYGGLDCRTPMMLYRARRVGWPIPQAKLSPSIIDQLIQEGADYFVSVPIGPLPEQMSPYLELFPLKSIHLDNINKTINIYRLSRETN